MSIARPTVLLVEDDPNTVLLIQRACRKAEVGFALKIVEDGELATQYVLGKHRFADRSCFPLPELVLLDLKLPRMSGFEVLAVIRGPSSPMKRTPVVMLASSRQAVDVNRAYELGANSYLAKPDGFEALLKMIIALGQYWFVYNQGLDVRE